MPVFIQWEQCLQTTWRLTFLRWKPFDTNKFSWNWPVISHQICKDGNNVHLSWFREFEWCTWYPCNLCTDKETEGRKSQKTDDEDSDEFRLWIWKRWGIQCVTGRTHRHSADIGSRGMLALDIKNCWNLWLLWEFWTHWDAAWVRHAWVSEYRRAGQCWAVLGWAQAARYRNTPGQTLCTCAQLEWVNQYVLEKQLRICF